MLTAYTLKRDTEGNIGVMPILYKVQKQCYPLITVVPLIRSKVP
jgi:hypothetical protein